jgi:hypothetical protein
METPHDPPPLPGPGAPPPGWGYPQPRPTNGTAIAALVVGIVALLSCPLIGAVAVYLGNRARNEIGATGQEGDTMALAGVILGWVGIGLTVLTVLMVGGYLAIMGAVVGGSSAGW